MVRDPPRKSEQTSCRRLQCSRGQRLLKCCRRVRLWPGTECPTQQRSERRPRNGGKRRPGQPLRLRRAQRHRQSRILAATDAAARAGDESETETGTGTETETETVTETKAKTVYRRCSLRQDEVLMSSTRDCRHRHRKGIDTMMDEEDEGGGGSGFGSDCKPVL